MKTVFINIGKIDYDKKLNRHCIPKDAIFYEDSNAQEVLQRSEGADIIVSKEYPMDQTLIEALPKSVSMICEAGTGYNNIDIAACKKRGIMVCNTPAYSTKRVAHTAMMMILMLASSMKQQERMLFDGNHDNFTKHMMVEHMEVNERVLGIIGEGNIGKEVIKIAQAFDMHILVYTRSAKEDHDGIHYVTLQEVLKQSDFVSLHCPLCEDTYHLIDEKALSLMKPNAFIINTSRGALIDEEALIQALQTKRIAGAGLDVQEIEPPRKDHPFFQMDQVIVTPHMGWRGLQTRARLLTLVGDTIQAYMDETPIHVVS